MIGLNIHVVPDGGEPFDVTATSRDILTWEKTNKGKSFAQFADGLSMADTYQIAFHAARRLGLWSGDMREFETCEIDILARDDEDGEGEDADPTQPGP